MKDLRKKLPLFAAAAVCLSGAAADDPEALTGQGRELLDLLQKRPAHRADTAGRIVFLECVGREAPVLKNLLGSLYLDGFFNEVKAVVFCHFNRVKDPAAAAAVLAEFAERLSCPVYKGFPYGHEPANFVLDFQRTAVIRDDTLTFEPPCRPLPYRKRP